MQPGQGSTPGRVLLVDDSPIVLKVLRTTLEDLGLDVAEAHSPAEAGIYLEEFDPEVVVTDLSMPGGSGLSVLQAAHSRDPDLPVIVLLSFAVPTEILDVMRAGAFDVVMKKEIQLVRQHLFGDEPPPGSEDPLHAAVRRGLDHLRRERANRLERDTLQAARDILELQASELLTTLKRVQHDHAHLVQREKAESLGLLCAGVGNQLNNPLSFLSVSLDVLDEWARTARQGGATQHEFKQDDAIEMVEQCKDGVRRIQALMKELRTFTRASPAKVEKVDLAATLRNVLAIMQETIATRAKLRVDVGRVAELHANASSLKQVLLALLHNATEAFEPEQTDACIEVSTRDEGERVVLEVADNGCGIAESDLDRAADPFFTTRRDRNAAGLGLSVARELAHRMNGRLELLPRAGRGTLVRLTLPSREVVPTETEATTDELDSYGSMSARVRRSHAS